VGFDDGGNCGLLLDLRSSALLGEVGDCGGGTWLAIDVLIDVGRTLLVRRIPDVGTVAVMLLFRL
jgi:hypothetical protein